MNNETPMTKRTVALLAAVAVVVVGALAQNQVTQRDREAALDAYKTQQAMAQLDKTLAAAEVAPEPEPAPSFRDGLSYTDKLVYDAAQRQVEKCDQDWLPSTCAKMRADFKAQMGWEF
jgi:hypothetical protein